MIKKLESVWKEIRAIVWPSRRKVYIDTSIVVMALVFSGVIIAVLDYGLSQLVKFAVVKISGG